MRDPLSLRPSSVDSDLPNSGRVGIALASVTLGAVGLVALWPGGSPAEATASWAVVASGKGAALLESVGAVDENGAPVTELRAGEVDDDNDYDNDGLSDAQEEVLGLLPWDPDSDADGFSDGEELARQSDPRSASSWPMSEGISASMTARGEDNKLKLVICVHEPFGEHNMAKVRIGALASRRVLSVPIGRFLGISEMHEAVGTDGSRIVSIEIPIHPGFVHAHRRVSFFLAAGSQASPIFGSAAKVDVVSSDGIMMLQRPAQASLSTMQAQQQGSGAIRQPIPSSATPSIPATWIAGAICYQRSTVVGGAGVTLLHQIIEADCLQGWDTYCASDCRTTVGDTYETIDPSALLGG